MSQKHFGKLFFFSNGLTNLWRQLLQSSQLRVSRSHHFKKPLSGSHEHRYGVWQLGTPSRQEGLNPKLHFLPDLVKDDVIARWVETSWGDVHLVRLVADVCLRVFEPRDGAVAETAHHRHQRVEVLQLQQLLSTEEEETSGARAKGVDSRGMCWTRPRGILGIAKRKTRG